MALREIKGIGPTFEKKLHDAGIRSIDDLVLADFADLHERTGITKKRLRQWRAQARKLARYKKAEVHEPLADITTVAVGDDMATVTIRGVVHENVPVYRGPFDAQRGQMEAEEMAVHVGKTTSIWFDGRWHRDVGAPSPRPKTGDSEAHAPTISVSKNNFLQKLKEWWRR
jgi:hypothetical protein